MDISKFDFTKFSKEKWQEILSQFVDGWIVDDVEVEINSEMVPLVTITCWEKMKRGLALCELKFNAFNVSKDDIYNDYFTKAWRKFMIKEFPIYYRTKLINHLQYVKEFKIQQADEEYYKELEEINNY